MLGSLLLTPLAISLAEKHRVYDRPDKKRKVHRHFIPRWGGLGLYLALVGGVLGLIGFSRIRALLGEFEGLLAHQLAGIFVGSTIVVILGMIDDKRGVRPTVKLAFQIIAVLVVTNYGVKITGLNIRGLGIHLRFSTTTAIIITTFWLLGFMNTVNLADGLDGLAAGIVAIASAVFCVVAALQGAQADPLLTVQLKLSALLAAAVSGACLGFLYYNFYPAACFMGDTGSMLLGFLLGTITVIGTMKTTALLALLTPVIVVALPILDVLFAIARRFRKKSSVMEADKNHIHHKLLRSGWTQREVVLLMYNVTLLLGIVAILLVILKR